ncbi:hypothetical protein LWI28_009094 [Acer negundo]|uniref:Dynein light chain n=1 Tax=Acer negundo TaxID=4023 RepID=A0AAD5IQ75_ACENE|nr:hypothetical protein LWI28_009094 [Acer negundo]KAK4844715.1 hypothetical protein QYF36_023590 [Acer negundo]
MEHHRRTIAAPDPNPSSTMDPTLKNQTFKPHNTSKTSHHHPTAEANPDSSKPSKTKPFYYMTNNRLSRLSLYNNSRINSSQKHITNPHSTTVDIRLQAKAMTLSADAADSSSKFSLQPQKRAVQSKTTTKEASKEMVKKSSKGGSFKSKKKEAPGEEIDSKKLLFVKDKDVKDLFHEKNNVKRFSVSLGRRRSLSGAQVELSDVLASCGVKIVSVDMPPFMQIHAVDFARKTFDSLEKFTAKTLALTLKREFDGVYGPAWHCIVGTSFGSFVTHSVGGFLYFSMDQKMYILLFKTTVQKAD